MKKVYSILVAYNPDLDDLYLSVEKLLKQTDIVVISNNSNFNLNFENVERIKVFNFGENLGIAAAQSIGMKWAFEHGADFIIQMDQDSVLDDLTVPRLIDSYAELTGKGYNIGVIGPRHFDKVNNQFDESRLVKGILIPDTNCEIVNATISSASLISKSAYQVAGLMEDSLFIDLVDWEYCWRLKKLGFLTVRNNDIFLGHRVGNGNKKIIGKIDARMPSPVRHYYHTRNMIHMLFRNYVPLKFKISNIVKLIMKLFIYPFAFEDGKERFSYLVKGVWHGFNGKFGRIDKTYKS